METPVQVLSRTVVQDSTDVGKEDDMTSLRVLKEVNISDNIRLDVHTTKTGKAKQTQMADAAAGVLGGITKLVQEEERDINSDLPRETHPDIIKKTDTCGESSIDVEATPVRSQPESSLGTVEVKAEVSVDQVQLIDNDNTTEKMNAAETGDKACIDNGENISGNEGVENEAHVEASAVKVADSTAVDACTTPKYEDVSNKKGDQSTEVGTQKVTRKATGKPGVRASTRVSRSTAQSTAPTAPAIKTHTRAGSCDNTAGSKKGTTGARKATDAKSVVPKESTDTAKSKKGKAASKIQSQAPLAKAKKITPFSTAKKVVAQKPKDLSPFLMSASKERDPKATPFSAGVKRPHSDHSTTPSKTVLDLTSDNNEVVTIIEEVPSVSKRLKPVTVEKRTAPSDGAGASVPQKTEKSAETSANGTEKDAQTPKNTDKTTAASQATATTSTTTTTASKPGRATVVTDTDAHEVTHDDTEDMETHTETKARETTNTQERTSKKRKASERDSGTNSESESGTTSITPANVAKPNTTADSATVITMESMDENKDTDTPGNKQEPSIEQTPAVSSKGSQQKTTSAAANKKRRTSAVGGASAKNSVSKKEALEAERERKRLAKEQERLEKARQREEEKQAKEEERAAKRRKIEQEKERKEAIKIAEREKAEKIKQEQKEAREKLRLAKEAEKQAVIDKRDKERAEKDAEKAKIDAEKEAIRLAKQKEEDKANAKKRKQAAMFSNFFVKPSGGAGSSNAGKSAKSDTANGVTDPTAAANGETPNTSADKTNTTEKLPALKAFEEYFIPFEVPLHARMAKRCVRRPLSEDEHAVLMQMCDGMRDSSVNDGKPHVPTLIVPDRNKNSQEDLDASKGMLQELIKCGADGRWREKVSSKTNSAQKVGTDEEVVCLSSGSGAAAGVGTLEGSQNIRLKLLQFHDNYRPPYFGTWSRKSAQISGRTPFKMDTDVFDYEVVSDEEWEEEPEGEDLSDNEKEADGDGEDGEEEEADGFVVPHGYLSDDEGVADGEGDDNDGASRSGVSEPRDRKLVMAGARAAMSHLRLRPVVIGCMYDDDEGCLSEKDQKQLTALRAYAIVPTNPQELPICVSEPIPEPSPPPPSKAPKAQTELTAEQTKQLVELVHANNYKLKMFSDEFRAIHTELRVKLVKDAIRSFAEWGKRNGEPFRRWWLTPEILEKYGLPPQDAATATPTTTASTTNTTATTSTATNSATTDAVPAKIPVKTTRPVKIVRQQAPVKAVDAPSVVNASSTTKTTAAGAGAAVAEEVSQTKAHISKAQPSIADFFSSKPTSIGEPNTENAAQPKIHMLVAKKKRVTPTLDTTTTPSLPQSKLADANSPLQKTDSMPQPQAKPTTLVTGSADSNSAQMPLEAGAPADRDVDTQQQALSGKVA